MSTCWTGKDWLARVIEERDRLRAEVAELKRENGMLKIRSHRISVEVTEAFSDNQRLRKAIETCSGSCHAALDAPAPPGKEE